jgi:hypothetical protein
MTSNIPINNYFEGSELLALLKPKPLRPDQIAWPRNQRKNRKNNRRLMASKNHQTRIKKLRYS